jgi:hypothetical protein
MEKFVNTLSIFNMDGGFIREAYYIAEYGEIPKIINLSQFKLGSDKDLGIDEKYLLRCTETFRKAESDEENHAYDERYTNLYSIPEKKCLVDVTSYMNEIAYLIFYTDRALIKDLEERIRSFPSSRESDKKKAGILMRASSGSIYSRTFSMAKNSNTDIELNYGKDFVPIYNKLVKSLSETSTGLVLLHGLPGTGKTSLIRTLIHDVDKEFIVVPTNMGEAISSPDFSSFLYEHTNCVLVIEDAEKIVSSRGGIGSSTGVANILNLTDGIMGDCLGVQIIATFNMKRDKIDEALLRKGRLIAENELKALSIEESNRLLMYLKKSHVATHPMTLAEIYNVDEDSLLSEKEEAIGFKFN